MAKKEILAMQEAAIRAQRAIESELGLELDSIKWCGTPISKGGRYRSVLLFFDNPPRIDSQQRDRIIELTLKHFGRNLYWIIARSADHGLWRWEHAQSPALTPEARYRLGLLCCDSVEDTEELYGTWVNTNYTVGIAKLVQSPSRWEMYDTINDIAAHYSGISDIKDEWIDSDGNYWYRCLQSTINIPAWYCLFKISKSATVLEWMLSHSRYPTRIVKDDLGYYIYYRKE